MIFDLSCSHADAFGMAEPLVDDLISGAFDLTDSIHSHPSKPATGGAASSVVAPERVGPPARSFSAPSNGV
jgi:hypothetical protein